MSYDLYFSTRDGRSAISEEDFISYFERRRHYQSDTQALYENEDTGVQFWFNYGAEESEGEGVNGDEEGGAPEENNPEREEFPTIASFNLNFNRPSFFVLEADIEVGQFVGNFDLVIYDPQIGRRGAYLSEDFISTWSRTNARSCSFLAGQHQSETYLYNGDELRRIWEWNYQREDRQLGNDYFVPRISLLETNGEVKSFVVWGDGIPIALPRVDALILGRQELKPRREPEDEEPEFSLVGWADVEPLLRHYPKYDLPLESFILDYKFVGYESVPEEIHRFFREQAVTRQDEFRGLAMDMIRDAEFFSSGN
jgi:hypothetical protein